MSYLAMAKQALAAIRDEEVMSTKAVPPQDEGRRPAPDFAVDSPESHTAPSRLPAPEEVAAMTLDEFARAGLIVRVWSNVLGCEVFFVSDNVPAAELKGIDLQIYRTADLRKLEHLRQRPRDLRKIHDVKNIFDGAITDVQPRDDDSDRREAAASSKGARAHCGKARASIRPTLPGQAVG